MQTIYIYVYKLNNGRYYVGRTLTPTKRFKQHEGGKGSAWVRLHGVVDRIECTPKRVSNDEEADALENYRTFQLMRRYGWRNVRGGFFCHCDEIQTQKALKHHGLLEYLDSAASTLSSALER